MSENTDISSLSSFSSKVAARAEAAFDDTLNVLAGYLKYPAISCDVEHRSDVIRLAHRIADDLSALGFDDARVLHLEEALPSVAASWMKAGEGKPTILIYGHFDLQPVKNEPWDTPPHEAVIKDSPTGRRMYARGAADDMGGWVSHLAAIKSWLDETGTLPCNIRLLIEGEEEIGSPNLERYMDAFPEAFAADAMVLTDCENPSTEIPGLTVSLRGLMEVDVVCEALTADVHSGLWGNLAPDANMSLVKLLSRLVDEKARLQLMPAEVPDEWRAKAHDVPITSDVVKSGAHICHGLEPLPLDGKPAAEWLWRQPAVTILSTTYPRPGAEKNALRTKASAVLSFRLAPGQTKEQMLAAVKAELLRDPPGGVKVSIVERAGGSASWLYEPKGPAFAAADRAYERAWGRPLLHVGIGGSIPFVALFGRRYGSLPLILNGVMDPETGAHGPNESMHLGVFRKAILANVYLYEELAKVL